MKTWPALSLGIMRQLYDDVSLYPGALKQTPAALENLPATFFRSVDTRAATRSLGQIDQALDHHDFEAGSFLSRTHLLQYGVVARLLKDADTIRRRRSHGRRHWVIQEGRRVARAQGDTAIDVASIDRLREDDPAASGSAASVALRKSRGSRAAAQGLGCWASAQRVCYRLDLAVMAIAEAISIAARDGHYDVLANLIERSVYITMDRGEYEWALQLALKAHARQARLFDLEGMGKTMVTTAVTLGQLGRSTDAIQLATAALPLVEASAPHRAAAYCVVGIDQARMGNLVAADLALGQCRRLASGRRARGRASWLQANIANKRGLLAEADTQYRKAIKAITEPVDALLIGAEFVDLLVRCGKPAAALEIARDYLLRLLEPLKRDPLDSKRLLVAAHTQLMRAALGAQLTLELTADVIARIHEGRADRKSNLRHQLES